LKYSIEFIKGLSALTEGDYEKASVHLKNASLERGDRIEAYFAAGLVFRKNKQYDRATYVLESILRSADIDPSTKRALTVELGRVMFDAGNYTIAHSLLEMATDKDSSILRAKTLRRLNKFEEAANTYKAIAKAEKINLDDEIGYCYYRCALETSGSRQSKFIKNALKYIPKSRCINMMHIDNNIAAGKSSKALVDIERFMSEELPVSMDDMLKFQTVFFDMKRTEEMFRLVMKRIQEGSSNPFFYIFAMNRLLQGENPEKAMEIIDLYLERFGFNNSIAKASLKLRGNKFLELLIEDANFYRCSNCESEFKIYTDACPNCQAFETLRPI